MPEETKSEEDEDGDILGEFAKHYEAGVYLEVKAEGYRRQGTQPTIEEDEDIIQKHEKDGMMDADLSDALMAIKYRLAFKKAFSSSSLSSSSASATSAADSISADAFVFSIPL